MYTTIFYIFEDIVNFPGNLPGEDGMKFYDSNGAIEDWMSDFYLEKIHYLRRTVAVF